MSPIKVLIVDDSALIRQLLKEILSDDPLIEVVATAQDAIFARKKIERLNPDVITLDVEMPRMNGLEFLKILLAEKAMPVIMVSSLTKVNCDITIACLEAGAVDFVTKPSVPADLDQLADEIKSKIKAAARARIRKSAEKPKAPGQKLPVNLAATLDVPDKYDVGAVLERKKYRPENNRDPIIAIGASTGGVSALYDVLHLLPPGLPGIVVAQHMPAGFTKAFATRMNNRCRIAVKEAENGDRIRPSSAMIAPGDYHLIVQRDPNGYYVNLNGGPAVNRHRPSVDVLFRSVANTAGKNVLGIILTGMGNDGAKGMLEMKDSGSYNIAQDENSCVVFGMPKSAIDNHSVNKVVSLPEMADFIVGYYRK
ncbi:MAG: chemotaxis response regulator protein-glutamate methylesterase [bacterium]